MTVASGVIIYAFVSGDYSIRYVQRYSDSVQPLFYKITSYWGGLDGSVMFWVFLLSMFGSVAVKVNRERHRELIPYVVAIIGVVEMFFLFLMLVHNNPFDTYLTESPTDGRGLNPLLQNFYMAIHPPTMYLGFVGLTIPFAFGMAALITGHLDDSWLRAVRRWTMFSWFFLSLGLTLGMIWAYEELGWGGYWGWDPVENAGAAAVVHRHRLPALGDGPGAARHAARLERHAGHRHVPADDLRHLHDAIGRRAVRARVRRGPPAGARCSSSFMAAIAVFSFGWVIYRLPLLQARHELDSWMSREAAFLANNWILLFSRVLRPVCDDVPDDHRSGDRRAAHRRTAVLQPLDDADRADAAAADRRRAAAGVAQIHAGQPARAVPVAGRLRPGDRWHPGGARRAGVEFRHLLCACGLRDAGRSRRRCSAAPTCGGA